MKRLIMLIVLMAATSVQAQQGSPSPEAKIAKMKALSFLEGTWQGSGWMSFGPNQKSEFQSREVVQARLGGVVLHVEGRHTAGERVVHDALGIFSYDEAKGVYRFKTYLANGREGDFEAAITDGKLQWGYEEPQRGQMRYTISLNEQGQWHEVGEMSRDKGATWFPFFEMTLTKQ